MDDDWRYPIFRQAPYGSDGLDGIRRLYKNLMKRLKMTEVEEIQRFLMV